MCCFQASFERCDLIRRQGIGSVVHTLQRLFSKRHPEVLHIMIEVKSDFMEIQRSDMFEEHELGRPALGWNALLPIPQLAFQNVESVRDFRIGDTNISSIVVHEELEPYVLADVLNLDMLTKELV